MAGKNSANRIEKHQPVATQLNLAVFHSLFVGNTDDFVRRLAVPRLFVHYQKTLQNHFGDCLKNPSQARFALAFAQLCDAFPDNATDFIPMQVRPSLALCVLPAACSLAKVWRCGQRRCALGALCGSFPGRDGPVIQLGRWVW
jgi:hypothetical protein